jgi:endo-1,3-1,4-beta-glycanase ExoK
MTRANRPMTGRFSGGARTPPPRVAILATLAGVAVLFVGWAFLRSWTGYTEHEARAVVAGEHPSQQPAPAERPAELPLASPAPSEAAPARPAAPPLPQIGKPFVDRFNRHDITDRWYRSDGWSNGPWMANDWRAAAVDSRPGQLSLRLAPGPAGSEYELASGEIRTHEFHRYGYFEVRMMVPRGPGIVTGMFTYADRKGSVRANEIDVEILGRDTRTAELTLHEGGQATSKKIGLPFDAAEGFHSYGFDWQPGFVRWYADGVLIHQESGPAARRLVRPQQLILNLWGSRELHAWVGYLDLAKGPWQLNIACAAYAPAYTGQLCS